MPIRVVLIDDHPIVLQGLQHLFARHQDVTVVAACPDAETGMDAVRRLSPDVVVLDLRMPGKTGLDVVRWIKDQRLPCRVVLLTAVIEDNQVVEALRLGAKGIVLKESPPEALVDSVRRVHAGEEVIDRDTMARAFKTVRDRDAAVRDRPDTLTAREIEIVRMVAQGLRNKAIAERLSISEGTVKVHLHNIYEKFDVDGRLELVICAQQKGWI